MLGEPIWSNPAESSEGSPKLCSAVRDGSLDQVEDFLAAGTRPNGRCQVEAARARTGDFDPPPYSTPLIEAASAGEAEIVASLLRTGADVDAVARSAGQRGTALTAAMQYGHVEVTRRLLDADARLTAPPGQHALTDAVRTMWRVESIEIKKAVVDAAARRGEIRSFASVLTRALRDRDGETAALLRDAGLTPSPRDLVQAARSGDLELFDTLLAAGAALHGPFPTSAALDSAVIGGQSEMVEVLVERGERPSSRTIVLAIRHSSIATLTRLLEADVAGVVDEVAVTTAAGRGIEFAPLVFERRGGFHVADQNGRRPLGVAAEANDRETMSWLLDAGAEIDSKVWEMAAASGWSEPLRILYEHRGGSEQVPIPTTAVSVAVSAPWHAALDYLIELDIDLNAKNEGVTPLIAAARRPSSIRALKLLDAGADVRARSDKGETALMAAASYSHFALLERLVDDGAEIDAIADDGRTALTIALGKNHDEAVRALIEAGASLVPASGAEAVLFWTAYHGRADLVTLLMSQGANADILVPVLDYYEVGSGDFSSPLAVAAGRNHAGVIEAFLEGGASIGPPGVSPLCAAAIHNSTRARGVLLESTNELEAPCGGPDWGATTPLTAAIRARAEGAVAAILIEAGADPDTPEKETGLSPLMILAEGFGSYVSESQFNNYSPTLELAGILLAAGADVSARDRGGETAFAKARNDGFVELIRLMRAFR